MSLNYLCNQVRKIFIVITLALESYGDGIIRRRHIAFRDSEELYNTHLTVMTIIPQNLCLYNFIFRFIRFKNSIKEDEIGGACTTNMR
jgi:hypothetical protein